MAVQVFGMRGMFKRDIAEDDDHPYEESGCASHL
jgi:hypothetical protein